ncbi:MAG: hypothetical protein P1Q69_20025, partial [Candidatus Thorarchaeota archaeon]|nr:hypothetical protein [Candidatus Thorarchaeota archaeon]
TAIATLSRMADEEASFGNGTYVFAYTAPNPGIITLEISLSKSDYAERSVSIPIFSEYAPEYLYTIQAFAYVTVGILALAAFGAFWMRVLSVPKMLRWIKAMIGALSKGKIPEAQQTRDRRKILLDIMNEDLAVIGIVKTLEDVSKSTISVEALDTDQLLAELASLVGLTESDVAVLSRDLDAMRPSERPGFLMEVIKQERARRAPGLPEGDEAVGEIPEAVRLSETEIEDLRTRLTILGIEEAEVDIMIEQAKTLSKAEIEALLDQLGGMEE